MRIVFLVISVILSIVTASSVTLIKPSEDDFYTPPIGFENAEVGDILKFRETPSQIKFILFPLNIKNSWQLLVRSEDSFGNPNAIVTTVMEPHNADPNKVLSYQTFQDSTDINCSPSYAFLYGSSISTISIQVDVTLMTLALNRGYYVVSPDYEGPKSTFMAGRQSGQATLNSIRAILNSKDITGIEPDAKVAIWGYSGGAVASGWATTLLPTYAPELEKNVIGTALGGVVTNITDYMRVVDGNIGAGLIPVGLIGLTNEYENASYLLSEHVDPKQAYKLEKAREGCLLGSIIQFFGNNILTGKNRMFPIGTDLLRIPELSTIIKNNNLVDLDTNEHFPKTPVFMYHGTLDLFVPIGDTLKTYRQWCEAGSPSIEFAEDLVNGHLTEAIIGAPAAWTWLESRFDGVPPIDGCSRTKRLKNLLYPNISQATLDYFGGFIDAVTFAKIGYQGLESDNITSSAFERLLGDLGKFFGKRASI
ncbi:uncharacterized protein KGF55_002987 [Candida pseudojiufengensis]|uniref:uncharacterized protein n=1 Tax=Candida pseudojiufengensis TaxID=497109 RepID=UPI0022240927|nr:uncharacterized protein KGF55_002987 [Candida pseudojiufengensis]KAI5963195.1 hypothetical protein KGF55_002987 [Candida pseudojiufengensis]